MEPGAVVVEHSHLNEQLGVVVEGSVTITAEGETRTAVAGDAYVVPPHMVHSGVAGSEGALLVESFVPVREEYERAWRAVAGM
jgi:quercetin dioxygenase-like cupin family protein